MKNKYKKAFDTFEEKLFPIHFYPNKYYWKNIDIVNEACDKAAKYDKKETPKKPTKEVNEHNDYDYYCLNCKNIVKHFSKYCDKCGQRINWEE